MYLPNSARKTENIGFDINSEEIIYGIDTPLLQGNMVRQRPAHVNIELIPLPLLIGEHHKDIQMYHTYVHGFLLCQRNSFPT